MRPWIHVALAFSAQTGPSVGPVCRTAGHTVPTPAPQLPELQAIPGAHALGGCTGQPLSAQCLAPSRLHSHVKNVREQARDEFLQSPPHPAPLLRGKKTMGEEGGSAARPCFPQVWSRKGRWAAGDRAGSLGLAGVRAGL